MFKFTDEFILCTCLLFNINIKSHILHTCSVINSINI